MKSNKLTFRACVTLALAIFILSPADDIILATLFGGAVFGFGSLPFYLLLLASSTISIMLWYKRKHRKQSASESFGVSLKLLKAYNKINQ
ncbi:MAG: hypothetical protein NWE92_12155 [Candidatus Bathyarchaeota archaeon]|nr:hypothetical protein [Candidatus Bathyarchaeota archaeon]